MSNVQLAHLKIKNAIDFCISLIVGKIVNFRKKHFDTTVAEFEYDYNSIMHYGPLSFR